MTELEQELYDYLWEGLLHGNFKVERGSVYSGHNLKPDHTLFLEAMCRKLDRDRWFEVFAKIATDWNNVPLNKALS